ncbi:hypothetical protein ACLOJK_025151 [Asimina triloba]
MENESREEKLRTQIASGIYYTDLSSSSSDPAAQIHQQLDGHMQSFEANPELFNLRSGVEMLGSEWKNHPSSQREARNGSSWKGLLAKSKAMPEASSCSSFYQPDFGIGFSEEHPPPHENLMVAPDSSWDENRFPAADDSSLRCVFPCEAANERPNQGLSLSLCPNRPSAISLQQPFELRETNHQNDLRFISPNSRDGFFAKPTELSQQQSALVLGSPQQLHQLKNSKYLHPAQELLNEFCSIGAKQSAHNGLKNKPTKASQWEEGSSLKNPALFSFDLLELQKRKAKLVSMLEEAVQAIPRPDEGRGGVFRSGGWRGVGKGVFEPGAEGHVAAFQVSERWDRGADPDDEDGDGGERPGGAGDDEGRDSEAEAAGADAAAAAGHAADGGRDGKPSVAAAAGPSRAIRLAPSSLALRALPSPVSTCIKISTAQLGLASNSSRSNGIAKNATFERNQIMQVVPCQHPNAHRLVRSSIWGEL